MDCLRYYLVPLTTLVGVLGFLLRGDAIWLGAATFPVLLICCTFAGLAAFVAVATLASAKLLREGVNSFSKTAGVTPGTTWG